MHKLVVGFLILIEAESLERAIGTNYLNFARKSHAGGLGSSCRN